MELNAAVDNFEEKNPQTEETPVVEETSPETPEEPKEEPKTEPQGLDELKESVNKLSEGLNFFSSRLDEIEKRSAPPVETEEPVTGWDKDKPHPTGWGEVRTAITETAEETARRVLREEKEAEQKQIEDRNRVVSEIDKSIDDQINTLESKGVIPKVVNPNDSNDPGRQFRAQIFGLGAKMDSMDFEELATIVKAQNERGYRFDYRVNQWVKSGAQPSGANAPVGSGSTTTTVESPKVDSKAIFNNRRDLGTIADTFGGE